MPFHSNFKISYVLLILILAFLFVKYALPYWRHLKIRQKTVALYRNLQRSSIPWKIIGYSTKHNPIYVFETGSGPDTVLIMGVFHGDEPVGCDLVVRLADTLQKNPSLIHNRVVLVPVVNPDALLKGTRKNSNKVDINRNFPTDDWSPVYTKKMYYPGREAGSEVETQVVMEILEKYKPDRIFSIHSPLRMNNFNGPARRLAEIVGRDNGYPVTEDVGYTTPGSFGTYTGVERKIPTLTVELPDIGPEEAWEQNYQALIDFINYKGEEEQVPNRQ